MCLVAWVVSLLASGSSVPFWHALSPTFSLPLRFPYFLAPKDALYSSPISSTSTLESVSQGAQCSFFWGGRTVLRNQDLDTAGMLNVTRVSLFLSLNGYSKEIYHVY